MAILFVSPKRRQNILLITFFSVFFLVLIIISIILLLPEIRNKLNVVPAQGVFIMPDTTINFGVVDSDKVKALQLFNAPLTLFAYTATDQTGKPAAGTISATSSQEAQTNLENSGLTVLSVKLASIGNTDPFVSYYQTAPPPTQKTP